MDSKTWTSEEISELISLYQEHECLWNRKHKNYRNRDKKVELLDKIATKFCCSSQEIHRKLHNLRTQMNQELQKILKKRGDDDSSDCYSKWKFFQQLKFLIPNRRPKSCFNTNITVEELHDDPKGNSTMEEPIGSDSEEKRHKRRRTNGDEEVLRPAVEVVGTDEFDRFGEYVALELRSLRSKHNRRKLKSEIRKAIVRVADEDDLLSSDGNTPSTSNHSSEMQSSMRRTECVCFKKQSLKYRAKSGKKGNMADPQSGMASSVADT